MNDSTSHTGPSPDPDQVDRDLDRDLGDPSAWEEITPRPAKPMLSAQVTIRLEPGLLEKLRREAERQGTGHTPLARRLLIDALDRLAFEPPPSSPYPSGSVDRLVAALEGAAEAARQLAGPSQAQQPTAKR